MKQNIIGYKLGGIQILFIQEYRLPDVTIVSVLTSGIPNQILDAKIILTDMDPVMVHGIRNTLR